MSNINFKTYVTNTFKPYLCAIRDKIDSTYSLMFERVKRQDELVRQTQELFSKNLEVIQQIRTKMIEYESFVESIKNNQATEAEVARLSKQVKELNYLYGVVLDIVYDLKYKGETDKTLPNKEKPFVSREELTRMYKLSNGIEEDAELTEEQEQELETFITEYFKEHPDQYEEIE